MALKGFSSFSCHTPLCCSCHYGGEWKTPERMSEMGESGAADTTPAALLSFHCSEFHKQDGGVVDVWRRNEQPGRKSLSWTSAHTVDSAHHILQHILFRYRSSGLQHGSLHDNYGSLSGLWAHIWRRHTFGWSRLVDLLEQAVWWLWECSVEYCVG